MVPVAVYRWRFRRLLTVVVVFVLLATIYVSGVGWTAVPPSFTDIVLHRLHIANPAYARSLPTTSLDAKCTAYFGRLPADYHVDLDYLHDFDLDPLVYRRDKWQRQHQRQLKRQLAKEGGKFGPDHQIVLDKQFYHLAMRHAMLESRSVMAFLHMRVFGKCYLEATRLSSSTCRKFEKRLYPWLTGKSPLVTKDDGKVEHTANEELTREKCFVQEWLQLGHGRGIVIPILRREAAEVENDVENIKRILRTLQTLNVELAVQIVHMNILTPLHRRQFAAISDSVIFVDVSPVVTGPTAVINSESFVLGLATVFHTFSEALVMSTSAIPIAPDLESRMFSNERYLKNGVTFFKKPSHQTTRKRKFNPGFHEVTQLIKAHFMASEREYHDFGVHGRNLQSTTSQRVLEQGFQQLLDPTIMVIDKCRVGSGLLMGLALQFHKVFEVRFDEADWKLRRSPEFLWLGQEMSGLHEHVNFNLLHGVGTGVLTPRANISPKLATTSEELCLASWGQVDDTDGYTLLYITSHQAENWASTKFQLDMHEKFSVAKMRKVENLFAKGAKGARNLTITEKDESAYAKFQQNALAVETVIIPATLTDHVADLDYVEPSFAWFQQADFGSQLGHPYWCCYNVVGKPDHERRGVVIRYNEEMRNKIQLATAAWLSSTS